MAGKDKFLTVRTTTMDKVLFELYCAHRGQSISEVVDKELIQKAVQPLRAALVASSEVSDGDVHLAAR